jgi:integrase/recombinase XerD
MQRSLKECEAFYLEALKDHNAPASTLKLRQIHLQDFITWCEPRGVWRANDVTKYVAQRYQRYLRTHARRGGKPFSAASQALYLGTLRSFFRYLSQENYVLYNPTADMVLPKVRKGLPRHVLTASEVETILGLPDIHDGYGLRDRAILETFYSTGIRLKELIGLKLSDVEYERGVLWVLGKGSVERVVPVGDRALQWIEKYSREVRVELALPQSGDILFLNRLGAALGDAHLSRLVHRYVKQANIGKSGSCHLFRHTAATLMLENGADIRYIQMLLGHRSLHTTEIYTQVSIKALKRVHEETHPAKYNRAQIAAEALNGDLLEQPTVEELFSSLAAEAAEELAL